MVLCLVAGSMLESCLLRLFGDVDMSVDALI